MKLYLPSQLSLIAKFCIRLSLYFIVSNHTLLYSENIDTTDFKPNYTFFLFYFIIFWCTVEVSWL